MSTEVNDRATEPLARAVAFYLPQFHQIPENDRWWGKGFTEWTNTRKAVPLFSGHLQPRVPTELGYYDLMDERTRLAQAELARSHGIEGFCYWHYWFGGGRKILERPLSEVLRSGRPEFPFALCWANESWTGVWHGAPRRVLIEQTYPGEEDYRAFFADSLPAFLDDRYIKVDGKPLFLVYSPARLPSARQFCDVFREEASRRGLPGLFLVGMGNVLSADVRAPFDSLVRFGPGDFIDMQPPLGNAGRLVRRLMASDRANGLPDRLRKSLGAPLTYDYEASVVAAAELLARDTKDYLPSVMSGWDNTPRSGRRGVVFENFSPEAFGRAMRQAVASVEKRPSSERFVFIKAWNEWAEGNVLEPVEPHGRDLLEEVRIAVMGE